MDFLDFLNNLVLGGEETPQISAMDMMQQYAATHHFDLSIDQIVQSVQEASNFFNIDMPSTIQSGVMTGVCNHMADTMTDDVLYINEHQMESMGITGKEAFDLVMTHEGAHRALQSLDTQFNSQQEELCCDMMAGVRAGLNDISDGAIGAMKASLINTCETDTHPAGTSRVQIIDDGVQYAKDYLAEHNCSPSISECINHFNELQNLQGSDAIDDSHGLVTLRPDDAPPAIKEYTQKEINERLLSAQSKMDYWEMELQNCQNHQGNMWQESENAYVNSCKEKYEMAQREHNFWSQQEPDSGIHGYTTSDIEWLEKQVRISSGTEQEHWLDKLEWAKKHVHGYYMPTDFENLDSWEKDPYGTERASSMVRYFSDNSGGFSEEQPMFTYEQLRNIGFDDRIANHMLDLDAHHSYSQRELFDVLYNSENPVDAYNKLMDGKVEIAINKADALIESIEQDFNISVDDIKGYTIDDVEWLEKMVRISSGSEQQHWLDELKWAKKH